jgi:hypothetical protein
MGEVDTADTLVAQSPMPEEPVEDVSRKTVLVLAIFALVVAVIGSLALINALREQSVVGAAAVSVPSGPSNTPQAHVSFRIVDPALSRPTAKVALEIVPPEKKTNGG